MAMAMSMSNTRQTNVGPVPKRREYANDCSLESVEDMMRAMAAHFYVTAFRPLGSTLDQDDLFQELWFTYERAKERFKPEQGVKFVTYCFTACRYRMLAILDQAKLHRNRYRSLDGFQFDDEDDGAMSADAYANVPDTSIASSPMAAHELNQEMRARVDSLTGKTRLVVLALLGSELNPKPGRPSTLPEIVAALKLTPAEISAVQKELTQKLGVGRLTWKKPTKCSAPTASESLQC